MSLTNPDMCEARISETAGPNRVSLVEVTFCDTGLSEISRLWCQLIVSCHFLSSKYYFLLAISLKDSLYNVKYAVSVRMMAKYIGCKKNQIVAPPGPSPSPVSVSEIGALYPLLNALGTAVMLEHKPDTK